MYRKRPDGMIEVITGPMFSGKSEELIKRITTLTYAEIKTLVIKPKIDTRFSENEIISRSGTSIKTYSVSNVAEIKKLYDKSYKAVVIDEVQFFDMELVYFIDELANNGTLVIVSGLDLDFERKPFGIMPHILAIAEEVVKLKAVCLTCKNAAACSYRKSTSKNTIELGDINEYEAKCRQCHYKAMHLSRN